MLQSEDPVVSRFFLSGTAFWVLRVEIVGFVACAAIGIADIQPKRPVCPQNAVHLVKNGAQPLNVLAGGIFLPDLFGAAVVAQSPVRRRSDAALDAARLDRKSVV